MYSEEANLVWLVCQQGLICLLVQSATGYKLHPRLVFYSMEATVICVDNSEWTRNSDYAPTRFQAQADCVNLLAGAKTQANAENTVGVLTMAGKSPRVLVTPTPDLGKILNAMQDLDIEGAADLPSSVQIAQLALKHRQNKNQRQRAVIFVGSPIKEDKVS